MDQTNNIELVAHYKKLYEKIIGPVIGLSTLMLCALHYDDANNFSAALAIIFPLFIFSQIVVIKNWQLKTPFGLFETRSDRFDCARWLLTFAADVFICLSLNLAIGEVSFIWTLLLFGCLVEIHNVKFRVATLIFGLACYSVTSFFILQNSASVKVLEVLYYATCMIGLTVFLMATEYWLVKTMASFYETKSTLESLEIEAENIKKNAFIGSQLQIYLHEVNNALMLFDLSGSMIETSDPKTAKRMKRALERIGNVKNLVLDQISDQKFDNGFHPLKVETFKQEIETSVVAFLNRNSTINVEIDTNELNEEDLEKIFLERKGALFYIISNLVKNAAESFKDTKSKDGKVTIHFDATDESLNIAIKDNGSGMSKEQVECILSKKPTTTKEAGHGWGTIFVVNECEKSNIGLRIESQIDQGTVFTLTIPLVETALYPLAA